MSTFDTLPSACIACELDDALPVQIFTAGAVFGTAWGLDRVMEKLCAPHRVMAHEAILVFEKAIDVEDHRRREWKQALTRPPSVASYDRGWWLSDCTLSCWCIGPDDGHDIDEGEPVYFSGGKGSAIYCERHASQAIDVVNRTQ